MWRRSLVFSCAQEINDVFGFGLLDFFVLDFPVVVLVEESEDEAEVLGLFLHEVIEDVELSPLDLLVVVQVIGFQKFTFELCLLKVLQVFGVGSGLNISGTLFNHLED
jgi:hypothetical protein